MPSEWRYTGQVIRWVDGDTVDMLVWKTLDFGFHITQRQEFTGRFRLITVDTPERGQEGYNEAREFCEAWMPPGSTATVITYKDDNFGRWLADLRFTLVSDTGPMSRSMSELLLRHGMAEVYGA